MKIVSLLENKKIEKRVSITPDITKKYISIGFEVSLPKDYGLHLGFSNDQYKSQGANIVENEKDLINGSDIVVQLDLPSNEKLSLLKENQNLIGVLNPFSNKEILENLKQKKLIIFL